MKRRGAGRKRSLTSKQASGVSPLSLREAKRARALRLRTRKHYRINPELLA